MSGELLPVLVLAAALAVTYLCCLRPVRREARNRTPATASPARNDLDRQLRQARAERDRSRAP